MITWSTSRLVKLSSCWNDFWFAKVSAYPIAAYRILLGIYLLFYLGAAAPNVALLFSQEGVYSPFLIPDIAPPAWLAWVLYSLTISLTVAFTVGYRTKLITPFLFLFFLYHFLLNIAVKACSYDRLLIMSLALMCFSDCNRVWSLARGNKKADFVEPKVSAWVTRLLALHLAIFYLMTGLFKALSPAWHTGEVLRGVMSSVYASAAGFMVLSWKPPAEFFNLMAAALIVFELSCPFFFFVRRLELNINVGNVLLAVKIQHIQLWFFLCGLCFHIGVWIFMQLPQFMICPIGYVLFLDGDELHDVLLQLWRQIRRVWISTPLRTAPPAPTLIRDSIEAGPK